MECGNILEMECVSKTYPGVKALDQVGFTLAAGEVHALLGENGAGKSTLIKALMGVVAIDDGVIRIGGKEARIRNPQQAADLGIAAVFQELSLIPTVTLAENVFLNKEGKRSRYYLNRREMVLKTQQILEQYHITQIKAIDVVGKMSTAKRQLAEIVKAVAARPRILILDEPTSSLTENETEKLFEIIRALKAEGVGIIYISHRMQELELLADRVTVLRDGKYIDSKRMEETTMDDLIKMMVGRAVGLYEGGQEAADDTVPHEHQVMMEVKGLCKKGLFQDINFKLYKGEVLGVAGLVGSGRSELMDIIFGICQADSGEILIDGKKASIHSVQDALSCGLALVPESRHLQGLILIHSIADNIALPVLKKFCRGPIIRERLKRKFSDEMISRYGIKTNSSDKLAGQLSGGNQQKVVIAKWLATKPKILIIDEPTVGIDVHAKLEIHQMIRELTREGVSVIMISSEMNELLSNSDRVMIMNDYRILGTFQKISQEEIMAEIMKDKNRGYTEEGRTNG